MTNIPLETLGDVNCFRLTNKAYRNPVEVCSLLFYFAGEGVLCKIHLFDI